MSGTTLTTTQIKYINCSVQKHNEWVRDIITKLIFIYLKLTVKFCNVQLTVKNMQILHITGTMRELLSQKPTWCQFAIPLAMNQPEAGGGKGLKIKSQLNDNYKNYKKKGSLKI